MKTTLCTAVLASILLAACSTPQTRTRVHSVNDVRKIRHVCIIPNPKMRAPADMEHHLATALRRHGISSEMVDARHRQRLYTSACRYNLRFSGKGSRDVIRSFNVLLRTPDHIVSQVHFVESNEAYYQRQPNVQQQTDSIVQRMLGKM